jgi:HSP20 family protein
MSVSRWDPFRDLLTIQDEMNQLFGRAFGERGQQGQGAEGGQALRAWAPALDISEQKDAYVVTVELPGVSPEDLEITLEDGLLTLQGERRFQQESSDQQYHRIERRYGSFRRSITLPSQVQADAIEAHFENGVLTVRVPKAEEAKPKKIEVQLGGGQRKAVEGTSSAS